MHDDELTRLAALEDRHWWYAARRRLLRDQVSPGAGDRALDVGAAAGGNTRVLRSLGWDAVAVEYSEVAAQVAAQRSVPVVRADATRLPFRDASAGLVVAFDVIEHIEDDVAAVREFARVLRPGGLLHLAVPADPALWSDHDVAVSHLRRYTRETLTAVLQGTELEVLDVWSWNVLLRPLVAMRRRSSSGSDLDAPHPVVNASLAAVLRLERRLSFVRSRRGVSLVLVARRSR